MAKKAVKKKKTQYKVAIRAAGWPIRNKSLDSLSPEAVMVATLEYADTYGIPHNNVKLRVVEYPDGHGD